MQIHNVFCFWKLILRWMFVDFRVQRWCYSFGWWNHSVVGHVDSSVDLVSNSDDVGVVLDVSVPWVMLNLKFWVLVCVWLNDVRLEVRACSPVWQWWRRSIWWRWFRAIFHIASLKQMFWMLRQAIVLVQFQKWLL